MSGPSRVGRAPLLALGALSLLGALYGGLMRLNWGLLPLQPLADFHGALMVAGFLGTLIGLERAVAANRAWAYLAPAFSGAGGLALAAGFGEAGAALAAFGAGVLLAIFAGLLAKRFSQHLFTMALGAAALLGGNLLLLFRRPVYHAAYFWAAFLVLTIWGERLELARLRRPGAFAQAAFAGATLLLAAGLALSTVRFMPGARVTGAAFLALTLWLARYDVAWRTVRLPGLTRYIAVCLLSGYFWLGASGLLVLVFGGVVSGPRYDAILHALFLGFVFSMIFGHAPVILPAVLGIPAPFRGWLCYGQLAFLHLSLGVRLAGDLLLSFPLRHWGGLMNVAALLAFFVGTAWSALAGAPRGGAPGPQPTPPVERATGS